MKKDSPYSFADASVPKKKGSVGPAQEHRESKTLAAIGRGTATSCRGLLEQFFADLLIKGVISYEVFENVFMVFIVFEYYSYIYLFFWNAYNASR